MSLLITGGSGLVGTALIKLLNDQSYPIEIYIPRSNEVNLMNYDETYNYFKEKNPTFVIHLAANVGGLFKNMNKKSEMFDDNMIMNYNVLKICHILGVKKVISCLSTCIFPDKTKYPIDEKMLHDGPPHTSNDAYAYAKRMLDIQSRAYREQYNENFVCVIPTNIYGENDNYNLKDGHVIPALIHKCYLAKKNNTKFKIYGSGKPLRQFIYSYDLAKLIMYVLHYYNDIEPIILSVSEEDEVSIGQIATYIAEHFDMVNNIEFVNGPDGQYKKTANNTKLMNLLYEQNINFKFTPIKEGLKKSIDWFIHNYNQCRK